MRILNILNILLIKILIISVIIFTIFLKTYNTDNTFNLKSIYNLTIYNEYNSFNNSILNEDSFKYLKISDIKSFFSLKFKVVSIEYKIKFYNNNNNLIFPSDLVLYNNLHIICIIEIQKFNSIIINSMPNIYKNNYFKCIEYFSIRDKIKIGIKLFKYDEKTEFIQNYKIFYLSKEINPYNNLNNYYKNDSLFDPLIMNNFYSNIIEKLSDNQINKTLTLKKLYFKYPICKTKRKIIDEENIWDFINIYNNYFCLCKGFSCLNTNISQNCKYFFYLNILDNNREIYKKTDFLFIDFIFNEYSSDDAYPVFQEMIRQSLPAHYITENIDIYTKYCGNEAKCLTIIYVNINNYTLNGDFLEKYLNLFLRLKQVISGGGINFNYINNLFYNIEYITYICVGHGISFFKAFLYSDFRPYGHQIYNKILIPPSDKLISVAKKYGWKDKNIIKMNLPKWDNYYNNKNDLYLFNKTKGIYNNSSIFLMFTWRDLQNCKNISTYYFKNILKLINNDKLNKALSKNKIILYFTLHHKLNNFKDEIIKKLSRFVLFIEENEISKCLSTTNLVISDFSSIIFDLMYREKPFIIFVPDAEDPQIKDLYTSDYYDLIQSIKNGTIEFENKFFTVNETVNKIIYYINNQFLLESKLEKFYKSFGFKKRKSINQFIKYLKKLN